MVSSFVPLVPSGLPSRWGGTGVFLGGWQVQGTTSNWACSHRASIFLTLG